MCMHETTIKGELTHAATTPLTRHCTPPPLESLTLKCAQTLTLSKIRKPP